MDPYSRAPKKNASHGNEVLLQDTTHLILRHCYQRESPCQDPTGNWTTQRPPDDREETQTAVVWSCFPFIRSGKNHLARHSEMGKKTRQTGRGGKTTSGMDRPGVRQVPEGSGEQGKMKKTGCKITCGAPTTLVVKGLMMMMMLTLIRCPFHPSVTAVAPKKNKKKTTRSFCQTCRWQVTPKHAFTLDPTKSECADYAPVLA